MSAPKVFLSHTSQMARLPEGRSFVQAALDALAEADLHLRDMRFFTADDRTPAEVCIDAVRRCDVYVGIFGLDYGSPVRDRPDLSYTELEFLTALERKQTHKMRVFAFLLDEKVVKDGLGPLEPRQAAFRKRVLDSGLTAAFFATPGDLQHLVYRTLQQAPSRPDRPLQHRDRRAFNFQGRGKELEELTVEVRAAVTGGASLSFVGLKGMGGIGKTALATELAERLAREFPGACCGPTCRRSPRPTRRGAGCTTSATTSATSAPTNASDNFANWPGTSGRSSCWTTCRGQGQAVISQSRFW
jgi:hypothetical protein